MFARGTQRRVDTTRSLRNEARDLVEETGPRSMSVAQISRLRAASAKGARRQVQAALAAGPRQRPVSPKMKALSLVSKRGLRQQAKQGSLGRTASPITLVLKSRPRSSRCVDPAATRKKGSPHDEISCPKERRAAGFGWRYERLGYGFSCGPRARRVSRKD